MNLTQKIAIAAGALTLAGAGIAAAVETPDAAEPGLTNAEEHTGFDVPVAGAEDTGDTEATEAEDAETEEVEADDAESEGTGPVDNHGAVVSAVAHMEFETGREHGEAVSTVARTNGGGEDTDAAETSDATEDDDAEDDDATDDDATADDGEDAGDAAAASAASGDHGRP